MGISMDISMDMDIHIHGKPGLYIVYYLQFEHFEGSLMFTV